MISIIAGVILAMIGVISLFVILAKRELFITGEKRIGYVVNSQAYKKKKTTYYKTTYKIDDSSFVTIETPEIISEGERKEFSMINGKYRANMITKEVILSCITIIVCGIGIAMIGLL